MTTKDKPPNGNHQLFGNNHSENDSHQYSNFNLNPNHKCLNVSLPVQLNSKSNNAQNFVISEISVSDKIEPNRKSSWNKSLVNDSRILKSFNVCKKSEKDKTIHQRNFPSGTSSSSTLSLHIAAYENSAEVAASDSCHENDEIFTKKKVWKISKMPDSAHQDLFEIPRQQKDVEKNDIEVMQFQASQKLLNPNESVPNKQEQATTSQDDYLPAGGSSPNKDNNNPKKNNNKNDNIHPILNQDELKHQEEESQQCASTQSSRALPSPLMKTPQHQKHNNNNQKPTVANQHHPAAAGAAEVSLIKNNNTEVTQNDTFGDHYDNKKVQQSPNLLTSKSSSSDSSDTTQNFSQDAINPPGMPIKLPGRKLDVTRKSSKTKLQPSPQQQQQQQQQPQQQRSHKRRLLPKREIFIPGGGDLTHKKRCFEHQRKRTRKATGPVYGRMKHKDFLRAVDRHRNSRNVIDCVCDPEQFGCIRSAQFYISQAGRQTKSFFGTFCCPPWPKTCFAKVAFWPPNRGYFFVSYAKHLPWSSTLVQKHKIVKAKRMITLDEDFSIGLEHSCCDRVEGVTTFVIQNSYKHFIAGFIAKPHKRIDSKLWIIYSHPNGSDLSDLMTLMPSPVQIADYLGANIVAYDYPGYGISTGKPSEKTFYSTIEAVIEYVTVTLEVPLESIVLWGYSIGTVCSVHAAMTYSVAGIFLFAPVASIMRTLKSNTCFDDGKVKEKTSCWDSFSNLDMIARVKSPLLIAHGELDTLIPISHGQALLEKAATTNSKTYSIWCKDVGHNNIPNSSDLWKRVKEFLDHDINGAEKLRAKHAEHHHDHSKRSTGSRKPTTHRRKKHQQQKNSHNNNNHTPTDQSSIKQEQKTPTK